MHGAQMLTAPPARATLSHTRSLINQLGFVQLDSIHVVQRAHHHILWSRLPGYTPAHLDTLQHRGDIFEHWTHDASLIPTSLYPHWRHRFKRVEWSKWFGQQLGTSKDQILSHVRDRIAREGPLMASDFEHPSPRKSAGWWEWKPAKAALEYLWRRGELAIPRRVNFNKVYDLAPRVLPHVSTLATPSADEHIAWACESALDRLNIATPTQIARFWNAVSIAQARAWCAAGVKAGTLQPVSLVTAVGTHIACVAPLNIARRIRTARTAFAKAADRTRVLNPFDPILRDRDRCAALFNFHYRFEAFTPAPKRQFGYYVLPILDGDRLIARFDPKLNRTTRTLTVPALHWEAAIAASQRRALMPRVEHALREFANFCGADTLTLPPARAR